MATPNKALNTPARGSNTNTWDVPLNANFTYLDTITAATLAVSITNANVTLSATEALNLRYACTGALTGNRALIFPASVGGFWIISNGCSGAFTLSARSGAGAAIVIPQGATSFVTSDGTTMEFADGAASNGQSIYAVDTGAADAYVVMPPVAVALKAGATVRWAATNANTGACTINVSGTGATAIKTIAGADPIAGAIAASGLYVSTYNGTSWLTLGLGASNFGLYSADAGATAGPTLDLFRDSASPAVSDVLGEILFRGRDSGAGINTYARAYGVITDPTAASEDGEIRWDTVVAGTEANRLRLGAGLYTPGATGGDKGVNTVNATELYHAGIPVGALVTLTAAASLSLDYTSLVVGIYDIYFNNILPTTNGADLGIRFSVAGVFITTGSYAYQNTAGFGTSVIGAGTDSSSTAAYIAVGANFSNLAVSNLTGSATLIVGGATAGATSVNGSYTGVVPGHFTLVSFGGRNTTSSQIDGIQLFSPTGSTIASGTVVIFRRA